jgi:predicted AAA+ superfamily ATPase
MKEMKQNMSYLLTVEEETEEVIDDMKIKIVPVWKWLLWPET